MSFKNVYLLLGPEKGKKKEFLNNLYRKITKEKGEKPEVYKFYPFEDELEKIITEIQSTSLFAQYKIITIDGAESISAADAKAISDNINSKSADTFIVFLSEQTAASKINKNIDNLVPKENKVIFWELFESDKRSWIIGFFKKQNQSISGEAISLILELVENNTEDLRTNCFEISLFYAKETEINSDMVEDFLYHSKEENAFTLFDKLAEGEIDIALEILNKIISSGNTHFILLCAGLLFQFRKLHLLLIESRNTIPDQVMMRKLGIVAKRQQKTFVNACTNYKLADVENIIKNIHSFEIAVRTESQSIHNTLASLLIFSITQKRPFIHEEFSLLY